MIKVKSELIDFHDEICCFNGDNEKSAIESAIECFNRPMRFEGREIRKTEQDLEIINLARQAVISFQAAHKRKKILNVPLDHIHVLKRGSVGACTESYEEGAFSSKGKTIIVERFFDEAKFALGVFHELFHAYSYSCPLYKDGQTVNFISGVSIKAPCFKRLVFFEKIEEAVISFMERKFFKEYIVPNDDLFVKPIGKISFSRIEEIEHLEWLINFSKGKTGESRKDLMKFFIRAQINGWVDGMFDFYESVYDKELVKWLIRHNNKTAVG